MKIMSDKKRLVPVVGLPLPKCNCNNACREGVKRATHHYQDKNEAMNMCVSCIFLNSAQEAAVARCMICKEAFGRCFAGDEDASCNIICFHCQNQIIKDSEELYERHVRSIRPEKKLKMAKERFDHLKEELNLK